MFSDFKLAVALVCAVLFNSTLLGIITYKGAEYRSTIRSRTEGLRVVGAVLSGRAPKDPLAKQLGSLLAAVSGEFVFGSFNGTLPAFLQNALATNFAGIATQVSAWSSQVISTFGNVSCSAVLCDHANQVVQCAGRTQYCGAKGEYVNCQAEAGCIPAYVTTLAAAVKSVADKIARLSPILVPSTTPPAFSNGIFRLDVLFSWFASQFDFVSWRAAGQVASNFVANVRHVDFSGCARDRRDRRERCYDINPAVTTILDTINQVSSVLAPPNVSSPPTFSSVRRQRLAALNGRLLQSEAAAGDDRIGQPAAPAIIVSGGDPKLNRQKPFPTAVVLACASIGVLAGVVLAVLGLSKRQSRLRSVSSSRSSAMPLNPSPHHSSPPS